MVARSTVVESSNLVSSVVLPTALDHDAVVSAALRPRLVRRTSPWRLYVRVCMVPVLTPARNTSTLHTPHEKIPLRTLMKPNIIYLAVGLSLECGVEHASDEGIV